MNEKLTTEQGHKKLMWNYGRIGSFPVDNVYIYSPSDSVEELNHRILIVRIISTNSQISERVVVQLSARAPFLRALSR